VANHGLVMIMPSRIIWLSSVCKSLSLPTPSYAIKPGHLAIYESFPKLSSGFRACDSGVLPRNYPAIL